MRHRFRNGSAWRVGWHGLLILGLLVLGASRATAQAALTDSELRAAFLFRFGQYVTWPKPVDGRDTRLVIGVVGDRALGRDLDRMIAGRQIDGRAVSVRIIDRPDDLDGLAIVYLSIDDPPLVSRVLRSARDRGVLSVGDAEGFTERGGMVRFFHEDNRLRFEVNTDVTTQAGLRISSQLLRLARIVKSGGAL